MTHDNISLAGSKITLSHGADGTDVITFSDAGTGRQCGACQLCCKLLPVPGPPLHKLAGARCRYQKVGKGCTMYVDRPFPCQAFACRWLADAECAGLQRPDRAHYVIDISPDYVESVDEDGKRQKIGVVQIWVDPAFPDAHRDPALRAYLLRLATDHHLAAIIRYSSSEATTLFAPPLTHDGEWHEVGGKIVSRNPQDAAVFADMTRAGLVRGWGL